VLQNDVVTFCAVDYGQLKVSQMNNDDGIFYLEGLSEKDRERDRECLALALKLRGENQSNDEILSRLREAGYHRISCMKAFIAIDGLSLGDAKIFVLESPAWSDLLPHDIPDSLLDDFDDNTQ